MESDSIYKKNYNIELSDVDFTKKTKLSSLFRYFEDVASMHVDSLGVGINTLEQKFGATWVLIRIRVDILRNPVWKEKITVGTWCQKPNRLGFDRDFIVQDADGNIIVRAVSKWIIFDINTRKLKSSDLFPIKYPYTLTERAIDCKLRKLNAFGELKTSYEKVIGYSDVDINEHLNNSKYIDFIMDCFDLDSHKKYDVKSIEVSYINEALPGDTLIFNKDISALNSNLVYIEGVNKKDNKVAFKSQIEIEMR